MCRWWGGVLGAGRPPAAPAVAGGSTGAALNGEASVGGCRTRARLRAACHWAHGRRAGCVTRARLRAARRLVCDGRGWA